MPFYGKIVEEAIEYIIKTNTHCFLKPAPEACGKELIFLPPKLSDLPAVMRNMGWEIAPALMEKWFKEKSFVLTEDISKKYNAAPTKIPDEHCDETTVKMEWIKSFSRGREAYENLLKKWDSSQIIRTVGDKIHKILQHNKKIRDNKISQEEIPIPSTKYSARQLHEYCQIQYEALGNYMSTIDDLYGSIGNAFLYLGVAGKLSKDEKNFTITDIGIYLRDVYEFNGFQFLGLWTKSRTLGKANVAKEIFVEVIDVNNIYKTGNQIGNIVTSLSDKYLGTNINYLFEPFCTVYNSDFRAYREKYNKGGDFYIFSDVMWEKPKEEITIPLE